MKRLLGIIKALFPESYRHAALVFSTMMMDMIGHQAIAPDRDHFFATRLGDEIQILGVVFGMERYVLTAIPFA